MGILTLDLAGWWLFFVALGRILRSPLDRALRPFADGGLAILRPTSLVLLTYLAWLSTTTTGLSFGFSLGGSAILLLAIGLGARLPATARPPRTGIRSDLLFLLALVGFATVRSLRPEIFGAEKYMDFAYFNVLFRTETLPPEDPWLAGVPANYYTFGYLLFVVPARLLGTAPEIAYNLALATIGATLFTGAVAIGEALTGRFAWGLLGGFVTAVLGNLDGARQLLLEGTPLARFDYWKSSRIVPDTINEFPFFSFVHGDLHPHVTALVIVAPLLGLLVTISRMERTGLRSLVHPAFPLVGILLAALLLANPWDVPVATLATAAVVLRGGRDLRPGALLIMATLVGGALLLALPFLLGYEAPVGGVGLVHARTTLVDLATVFGHLLVPAIAATAWLAARRLPGDSSTRELLALAVTFGCLVAYVATGHAVAVLVGALATTSGVLAGSPRSTANERVGFAFVAVGALAILAGEIVYLRDSYGSQLHRMNTIFKVYFQAWLLLGIAFPFALRRALVLLPRRALVAPPFLLLAVAGVAAAACFPVGVFGSALPGAPFSLDGLAALDRRHPDDAAAIRWLRANADPGDRVLEATGDPYSYFARVSSNTGIPTLLGWANHERVWRGPDPRIDQHARDVTRAYGTTDAGEAAAILASRGVRWIFVGELERGHVVAGGLAKFAASAAFVERFRSGETLVYELVRDRPEAPKSRRNRIRAIAMRTASG